MRTKIIFTLAIVLGLITTVLFFNFMKKYDAETKINEQMVEIVVAKQSILENEMITPAMVTLSRIPKLGTHSSSLTGINQAVGKIAVSHLEKGEGILNHHLKNQKDEALLVSRKVKDGFRAVSVGVNFVQSVSNLIEPEDEVDVVFTEDIKLPIPLGFRSELILSKVRVLAIGRRMIETDGKTPHVEYSAVTLELSAADAVKMIQADERGNISLILNTRAKIAPILPAVPAAK